jgi:hypothetical protein
MPYSTDVADLLAVQLTKFVTLNRHQLAGQVANLDFWMGEVAHALSVVDGYHQRFEQLKSAQQGYVSAHRTIEFSLDDPCCTVQQAAPPRRISGQDMQNSRRAVCDATYRFLVRCFREGLISDPRLRETLAGFDIAIEERDLAPKA